MLIRRDGEEALYLGNHKPDGDAGRVTRTPLSKRDAVAVKALHGENGLIRGTDRQGRQVVAAVRALPDSQWLVCTQVPLESIDKPLQERELPVSFAVVSLILAAGVSTAYLWRVREKSYGEAKRGAELEKQALFTHYNFLSRSVSDAILLLTERGQIVEANDRALEMYGFSREELLAMNAAALLAAENQSGMTEYWLQAEKQPEGLSEAAHARKSGTTFQVEVSVLKIDVEGGHLLSDDHPRHHSEKSGQAATGECQSPVCGAEPMQPGYSSRGNRAGDIRRSM